MEIFVGNLPFETSQEELVAAFEKFGPVKNVKMLTDRETGRFRGIAFISMDDVAQGQEAINSLNGTDIGGRPMKVEASQPRESFGGNRSGGGFGGNRGGGFGGNRGGGFGGGNRGGGFGGGKPFKKRY